MLVVNGMSPLLAWVVRNRPLNGLGLAVVATFAIGNALAGMWLAWRLIREPAPNRTAPAGPPGSDSA